MQIDYALILSAGLGTRMGEIGKKLPKVLWPIYFKSLLELQIQYCQRLGIKKIYINTHYLHEEIALFLETNKLNNLVTVLHEDPLLGSGGAIHNLASQKEINYKGKLLIVNGDQFLFFDQNCWDRAFEKLAQSRAVLFGIAVDAGASYNRTIVKNGKLVEIIKNLDRKENYETYSGLGLLNLDGLEKVAGISSFFDTVANFKKENIQLITPSKFEYWDFGTFEIYAENIFKISDENFSETEMVKFLKSNNALNGDKGDFVIIGNRSIDLEGKANFKSGEITGFNISQKI